MRRMRLAVGGWWLVVVTLVTATAAQAQTLTGPALVKALQAGGHVIVMRHGSSPNQIPAKPNADNVPPERQLDDKGRATAAAMGESLRRLKIPIGEVHTSPTYRARETARLMGLASAKSVPELGEGTGNMQAVSPAQTGWLQKKVREFPSNTNTVLVTHVPNVTAAFPEISAVDQGEALVFAPAGQGNARLVGRIKIEEWPSF